MGFTSMRQWLDGMRACGNLKTISKEVDLRYELAALGKKADGHCGLLFENVKGHGVPVVTGLASTREMFAKALGVTAGDLVAAFAKAQDNPRECRLVANDAAPVKETITCDVDLARLPIPIHHEKDGGPYITAGVLVSKDPVSGQRNLSIHRLHVLGPNKLGILILPRHLHHFYRTAEQADKPLDVAIAIGLDPILLLASQALAPLGFDEYTIASALYENPLELVRCETVDIEVPAQAEIVLEGKLLPHTREMEGPFGEYPKYYGPASLKPVIELSAMTSRRNPIFHTIVAATMEHMLLGAIPREGGMLQVIRGAVPNVRSVHLTPGGSCRYHAVVSLDKQSEGEPKNVMLAAFTSSQEIKRVVVVDPDVDIFDPIDVEWALATRFQASRDALIIKDALGNKLDPSSNDGISDKMGLDATIPLDAPPLQYERIRIPGDDTIDLLDYIQ